MIGTITLHHNANYGANLQAYALVKCLSSLTDNEVCLVDYRNEWIKNLYRVAPFDIVDKGIVINVSSCKRFVKILLNLQGTAMRNKRFSNFRKKSIPTTRMVTSAEEIKALGCSHLFIGSDQIWNDWITGDQKNRVFYGNVKQSSNTVASYAPSLGNSRFSDDEDCAVSEYINKFDFLSVRESELIELIHNRYQGTIDIVCDPVFLLTKEEWESLCMPPKEKEQYVFVYLLERNPFLFELAQRAADLFGLKMVVMSDGKKLPKRFGIYDKAADPIDFISGIRNAQFVITNSFHGTVFSMIFHKRFITVPDTKRGIRMVELLNRYSLQGRLLYDLQGFSEEVLDKEIDYSEVERLIASDRAHAMNYLKRVLEYKPSL